MELRMTYMCRDGAYLLAHDELHQKFVGVFCWCGESVLATLLKWKIVPFLTHGLSTDLARSGLPKSIVRASVLIEGEIAICIAKIFEDSRTIEEICPDFEKHQFPPLPRAQILSVLATKDTRTTEAIGICYVDPKGITSLAIVRSQLHGLMVLSYMWMPEEQKQMVQRDLAKLPVAQKDDLEIPVLVTGDIVTRMILHRLHYVFHFPPNDLTEAS